MIPEWKDRGIVGFLLVMATFVSVMGDIARATSPTPTPTPTPVYCATTTPEPLFVDPVISPTDELSQTIYVHAGNNVESLEVSSEAGTFVGEHPFDQVEVSLLPNTANHLRVTSHIRRIVEDGCTYGDYTLTTTTDLHGAPLTIVQGTTFGPTIAVERYPPGVSLTCSADFEIRLRNASEGDDVLYISFISLHHAYSQGDYGTDFSWDTSGIELPLMLSPGEFASIPVSYRGTGLFDSRLVLQVVSNARNNSATQYLAYKGKRCPTPTPTGVTGTVTPTETPEPICPPLAGLSPAAGPPGTVVVMEGSCYWIHSGRSARVYLDGEFLGDVSGLTGGDFRTLIEIPPGTTPGVHSIRLSQTNGFDLTSGPFEVTGPLGPCTGDCNQDTQVDVSELVTSIGIALGRIDLNECPAARSAAEDVTIADVVAAVRNTLQGCITSLDLESFGGAYSFLGASVDDLSHPNPVRSSDGQASVVDGEIFLEIEYGFGTFEVSGVPDEVGHVALDGTYQENEASPIAVTGSAVLSQTPAGEWIGGELIVEPPEPLVPEAIRFSMRR